jgi:TonB family protein
LLRKKWFTGGIYGNLAGMAFPLRYFLCLFLFSLSGISASAQPSPANIANTLNKHLVLLREGNAGDDLAFNAQGDPIGNSPTGNFPLSGITIQKIRVTNSEMEIRGHRNILLFTGTHQNPQEIQYVAIDREVHITIAQDVTHPEALSTAVNKIFALDIQSFLAAKNPPQQQAWLNSLAMFSTEEQPAKQNATGATPDLNKLRQTGADLTLPKVLSYVDPQYSQEARDNKAGGKCPISMIVDQNGDPTHIRVIRSLGMGLDRNAVIAISQYRFSPAKVNGQPVAMQLHLEVSFKTY